MNPQQRFKQILGLGDHNTLTGMTVVVTGAGSGIGRETLLRFAEAGANVAAADINFEAAERSVMLAGHFGNLAKAYETDVGNASSMRSLAGNVQKDFGVADVVINNAGIGLSGPFLSTTDEDWERVLNVNLWSVIRGSRLFAQHMVTAGMPGHIVNVASMAAFTPMRDMSAYATSKAAVQMLSDCMRTEFVDYGIHVSCICPGMVDTAITTSTRFVGVDGSEQQRKREAVKQLYQRRNLKPKAVAEAIYKAVANRQEEVLVGTEAHASRWLNRIAPAAARRLSRIDPAI